MFRQEGKLLEAQRLGARTRFDMEMLLEVGHCPGIENYARWFSGKAPGEPPYTLIDFFPEDFLMVVDESHVTLPQVRAMFAGDHSRKMTLVEHGFRLPSALDNRPLRFDEWEKRLQGRCCSCRRRRGLMSWNAAAARWSSRSSGRRGWSIRSCTSSPRAARCPT